MFKVIITELRHQRVVVLLENDRVVEFHKLQNTSLHVGDIYIGKVKKLIKNIQAAFVQIAPNQICYLSLDKLSSFYFTKQSHSGKVTQEDELIVQVSKEATKMKCPVVKGDFNLSHQYAVLISGSSGLKFSQKIADKQWISKMRQALSEWENKPFGFIIRTNAINLSVKDLHSVLQQLEQEWKVLCQTATFRPVYTALYKEVSEYQHLLQDLPMIENDLPEVITDLSDVYTELCESSIISTVKLRFYEDELLPLGKLYSLETALEHALKPLVWLKSGAFLVIEPTEALTVIDVNTGKNIVKKSNKEETFFKTNLEAAKEIAVQLRLRNLSGIIIVDFIDMEEEEHRVQLLRYLESCLKKDSVKTVLVDMTKLHLVEITRKRMKKPLYEVFSLDGKVSKQVREETIE